MYLINVKSFGANIYEYNSPKTIRFNISTIIFISKTSITVVKKLRG